MNVQNSSRSILKLILTLLLQEKSPLLITVHYVFYLISQIQILTCALIFSTKYLLFDQQELIGQSIIKVLKTFILDESIYIGNSQENIFQLYIVIMLAYYLIFIGFGGLIIFLYYRNIKIGQKLAILYKLLYNLNLDVLFLPFMSLQYSMITYPDETNTSSSSLLFQPFMYDMGIVLIVINLSTTFIGSLFNFDPWIYGNIQAIRPSSLSVLDFLFKVEIFIGYALTDQATAKWFTLFMQIILLVSKAYIQLNKFPYFDFTQGVVSIVFTALTLESCLVNLIMSVTRNDIKLSSTFIWLVLCPAIGSVAYHLLNNKVGQTFEAKNKELNVYKSLQKYSYIQHVFQYGSYSFRTQANRIQKSALELQFSAMVYKHRVKCNDKNCFCHIFNQKADDDNSVNHPEEIEDKLAKFTYHYTKRFLESAIACNTKGNIWLKITLIQHIIKRRPDQAVVALSVLHSINQSKLSLFEQFVMQKIVQSIKKQEVKRSKGEGEIDLAKIVYYKDDIENFRKKLGMITEMTVGFWDMLQSGNVKVSSMLNLTQKSNYEDDKLRIMWEKLNARHSGLLFKDLLLYAGFLTTIRNCEKEGRAVFRLFEKLSARQHQSQKIFDKITSKNLNDDKNLFLTVSLSKRSLGTIKQVQGKGAHEIVGWTNDDLTGSSINMIIPSHFREKHDFIMTQHLDDGTNEKLQTNILVLALKKSGFINPVYVYITMADNITQELNYAAVLRPARVPFDVILIGKDGKLINCTEKLAEELKVTEKAFLNLRIQEICPEFDEIFKIYHMINCVRKLKKFRDYHNIEYSRLTDYLEELYKDPDFISPKSEAHLINMLEIYSMCLERSIMLTFIPLKSVTATNHIGIRFNAKFTTEPKDNPDILYIHLVRISSKALKTTLVYKNLEKKKSKFSQHSNHADNSPRSQSYGGRSQSRIASFLQPKVIKISVANRGLGHISIDDSAHLSQASEGLSEDLEPANNILDDFATRTPDISIRKPLVDPNTPKEIGVSRPLVDVINKHSDSSNNTLQFMKKKVNETEFDCEGLQMIENQEDESEAMNDELEVSKAGSDDVFYDLIKTGQVGASVIGSQAQSVNSSTGNISELEQVIQKPPKDNRMRAVFIVLTAYFIAITTGFIVFTNLSSSLIETAATTSDVIRTSTLRAFNLIELDRRVRCSNLVHRDFLPKFKSGRGVSDYSLFCLLKAENHMINLQNLTINISKAIGNLDMDKLPEFKEPVQLKPTIPTDPILNVTLEGAIASIISASIRLLKAANQSKVTAQNPDMKFILDNVFNDILYHSEKIPTALFNYIKQTNDTVINYLEIITIIVSIITAIMISISIYVEAAFLREKRWFILGIAHMDEKMYIDYVKKIRIFMKIIKEKGIIIQHNNTLEVFSTMGRRDKKTNKINRVNFQGFSNTAYVRIISLIFTMIAILIIQVSMLALFESFNEEFLIANENLIVNDNMLLHYSLTFGAMYEYISENMTSTIRNKPIVSEINRELEYLRNNTDFYKMFYNTDLIYL